MSLQRLVQPYVVNSTHFVFDANKKQLSVDQIDDEYTHWQVQVTPNLYRHDVNNRFRMTLKNIMIQYGFTQINEYNNTFEFTVTNITGTYPFKVAFPPGNYTYDTFQKTLMDVLLDKTSGLITAPLFRFTAKEYQSYSYETTDSGTSINLLIRNNRTWIAMFGSLQNVNMIGNDPPLVMTQYGFVHPITSIAVRSDTLTPISMYTQNVSSETQRSNIIFTMNVLQNFPSLLVDYGHQGSTCELANELISRIDFYLTPRDDTYKLRMTMPWSMEVMIEEVRYVSQYEIMYEAMKKALQDTAREQLQIEEKKHDFQERMHELEDLTDLIVSKSRNAIHNIADDLSYLPQETNKNDSVNTDETEGLDTNSTDPNALFNPNL